MKLRLEDKVVIVTGAASGIGRAVAQRIMLEGGAVVAADLNQEALQELRPELELERVPCDVCNLGTSQRLVDVAMARFGRIDGFVPCAGMIRFAPVMEVSMAQWDHVLHLNLRAVFFQIQTISKVMSSGGAIVTLSSTSGHGPRPNNADYGVSKAGINHLTKTFALELAPKGICVNAVSPGVIDTSMWRKVDRERGEILGLQTGQLTKQMEASIPMGRVGKVEEVASLIAFLLSGDATYITGQIITIDGGYKLSHP